MALDFGKLDFSVSFNPTSAFPIDARSYFENLTAAKLAAASAKSVGSKESAYYYGQTLVVVENDLATFYMIQTNGTLIALGKIQVDTKQFEFDEQGNLSLKGFKDASSNQVLKKNSDGSISWTTPVDSYSKEQTDNKINQAIANATHLKRKVVKSVAEIEEYVATHEDSEQYIFMVPTGLQYDSNKFDEYMVVTIIDSDNVATQIIERVGSWEVDLNDYAKKADVQSALNGKVDKKDGYTLLSPEDKVKIDAITLGEDGKIEIDKEVSADQVVGLDQWITKNSNVVKGLSENNLTNELYEKLNKSMALTSVDTNQLKVDTAGKLSIIALNKDLVTGLNEALQNKASQQEVNLVSSNLNMVANALNSMREDVDELKNALIWKDI